MKRIKTHQLRHLGPHMLRDIGLGDLDERPGYGRTKSGDSFSDAAIWTLAVGHFR